jgi:hypothetical protein
VFGKQMRFPKKLNHFLNEFFDIDTTVVTIGSTFILADEIVTCDAEGEIIL